MPLAYERGVFVCRCRKERKRKCVTMRTNYGAQYNTVSWYYSEFTFFSNSQYYFFAGHNVGGDDATRFSTG